MPTVNILGVPLRAQPFEQAVTTLIDWAQDSDQRRYVSTCPVYTVMSTHEIPEAKTALTSADMVTADGMPLVWVQRRKGINEAERVYGPDLMRTICGRGVESGLRHYFWGGLPGVPEKLTAALQAQYGDVQVAGMYSPPYEALGTPPNADYIAQINAVNPDIVWVGLGSPKQDVWMHLYRPHLNAPLLIAVGAAFDFIAGTKSQAPVWMQRSGTEWVFRLAQEPRRLAKRYLVYNSLFLWRLAKTWGQVAVTP